MNAVQKWLDSGTSRPVDLDEYKIVLARSGYVIALTAKRFVSNGDGTESVRVVARREFDARTHAPEHLAEIVSDARESMRHAIDKAARSSAK